MLLALSKSWLLTLLQRKKQLETKQKNLNNMPRQRANFNLKLHNQEKWFLFKPNRCRVLKKKFRGFWTKRQNNKSILLFLMTKFTSTNKRSKNFQTTKRVQTASLRAWQERKRACLSLVEMFSNTNIINFLSYINPPRNNFYSSNSTWDLLDTMQASSWLTSIKLCPKGSLIDFIPL